MSAVQVREIPSAGSWFPTGYYGHSRAKSRIDLCDYYRQLARPEPPKKFLERQNSEATTHRFSQHDNRAKYENDPLIRAAETGFGRRRSSNSARGGFNPLFLGWMPNQITRHQSEHGERTSVALVDASDQGSVSSRTSQASSSFLVSKVEPSLDTTVYTRAFNHGQPDDQQAKQIRRETFQRFASSRARRLLATGHEPSTSVASCMLWNRINATKSDTARTETIVPIQLPARVDRVQPQKSQSLPEFIQMKPSRASTSLRMLPSLSRSVTSLEPVRLHRMDDLVAKYM